MNNYSIIIHSVNYELWGREVSSNYTRYLVLKDGTEIGNIYLLSHLSPRISVSQSGKLAIYGGVYVYIIDDGIVYVFQENEDVHKLWIIGDEIIEECDTFFVCRYLFGFIEKMNFIHDEIIVTSTIVDCKNIIFSDLQNRKYSLNIFDFSVSSF